MLISFRTKRVNKKTSVSGSRAGVRGGESVPAGAIAHPQLATEWVVFLLTKKIKR